ncbi:MAG: hypothetical protein HY898_14285 [Deltaproteobacteria bacterium]|nr:hypothetical protein [Deltaproteobacteria bacterium]
MAIEVRRSAWALLGLCVAASTACKSKSQTTPEAPATSAIPVPSESAVRAQPAAPTAIFSPEVFAPEGRHPTGVYSIEGALMVVEKNHVGRINGESVEWIGDVPKEFPGMGDNIIGSVQGRWPDLVGAVTYASNGRAPYPTFFPLTWKSTGFMVGPGGQGAWIQSVARIGDTLMLVAWSIEQGTHIVHMRGPKVKRKFLAPFQLGCKKREGQEEFDKMFPARLTPGVAPDVIGTTPAGTMVSVGYVCEDRGRLAAEVWDNGETSRLIDLTPLSKKSEPYRTILKGEGDELFVFQGNWAPVLRYREGKFDRVPDLGKPISLAFTSPKGRLHAASGRTIHRLEGERWVTVARIAEVPVDGGAKKTPEFSAMATDGETFWASNRTSVFRFRPMAASEAGGAEAPPLTDGGLESCSTPFVYLYEVSYNTPKNYNFPKTQKALATFPDVAALTLVVFDDFGRTRVGVKVTSPAQGEALLAHLKTSMKDEEPRLSCFDPWAARTIPIERPH